MPAGSAAALICDTGALIGYSLGQLSRAMAVDRRFVGLRVGLVDASVVALAESLGVHRLATRDLRHFAAVRLGNGQAFELVVHPTDPDES